ncbi:MAG TPA: serine/threonine-protein kinase [Vicinamibacterales bacterium]|nr:serine/threonine-protein kinase [Vicinamibacterales bacterium]
MTTVFHRVGRYEIHEQIGRGGMAVVFLATDTLTDKRVALKLVAIESDRDGREILEAEQFGAKLQEEFCRESRYVPAVYEHGTDGKYFFIAMEYLGGRNLSDVIGEGPLSAVRAVRVASQLCEFLQDAAAFERTLDGRPFTRLLHGDLKPRNIRVLEDDEIKVFDFGIAKALSLSRKVTRNDFGSTAYLSPERLESGGEIDAQAEFWAVGVLLYEMISGVQPFRAQDTRRLEQRIRARQPPPPLDSACPRGLQAIIAKLLAPDVADRYASAGAIHDDLQRFTSGAEVLALREGWPDRQRDEQATRRTVRPDVVEDADEVTRRTLRDRGAATATVATPVKATVPAASAPAERAVARPPSVPLRTRLRKAVRQGLIVMAILIALNELRVYVMASALAESVPEDLAGVGQMWNRQVALREAGLGLGVIPLERALTRQSLLLADRTFARYRTAGATVFEREWRMTRDALAAASGTHRSNRELRAALRYCEGHLRRIDGEARSKDKQAPAAQEELAAAVTAFREAAELRGNWPDPFLGLMRTFIAMEDIERGADALAQAQRYGYTPGNRDWVLLGEGYLTRAGKLVTSEELEPLTRAADAYNQAIAQFSRAAGFGNATLRLRDAQRRLKEVQERLDKLSAPAPASIGDKVTS